MNKKSLYLLMLLLGVVLIFKSSIVLADVNLDENTENIKEEMVENSYKVQSDQSKTQNKSDGVGVIDKVVTNKPENTEKMVSNKDAESERQQTNQSVDDVYVKEKQRQYSSIPSKAEYNKNIQGVTSINLSTYLEKYDKGDKFLTYVGFEDCKHCRKFSPVVKTFLSKPNPPLYYLDYGLKGSFSTATPQKINAFFESFNEPFQFMGTPTIALIADHQVKSMVVGDDSTLEDLNQLVNDGQFEIKNMTSDKKQKIVKQTKRNIGTVPVKEKSVMSQVKALSLKSGNKEILKNPVKVDTITVTRNSNNKKELPQTGENSGENTELILMGIAIIGVVLLTVEIAIERSMNRN